MAGVSAARAASSRYALIVASYDYRDAGLKRLVAPQHDAESLAVVLADVEIAGFDVTTLVNEPHHVVGEAIGDFFAARRRDDLALLYFSGHGLKDDEGRLFLAMANTRRDGLLFTALSAQSINDAMNSCLSRQKVLILDCCYSGAFPGGWTAKADPAIDTLARFRGGRGKVVLTASDRMQYSFEGNELRGSCSASLFTHHLVEGLRSGAADQDGDGDIALDELYAYVYDRVVAEMPQQRPKKQDDVEGRIVIARNVHWDLPGYVRNGLASPIPSDRLQALTHLERLHATGNPAVRARVVAQMTELLDDDSKQVSGAAAELLRTRVGGGAARAEPGLDATEEQHKADEQRRLDEQRWLDEQRRLDEQQRVDELRRAEKQRRVEEQHRVARARRVEEQASRAPAPTETGRMSPPENRASVREVPGSSAVGAAQLAISLVAVLAGVGHAWAFLSTWSALDYRLYSESIFLDGTLLASALLSGGGLASVVRRPWLPLVRGVQSGAACYLLVYDVASIAITTDEYYRAYDEFVPPGLLVLLAVAAAVAWLAPLMIEITGDRRPSGLAAVMPAVPIMPTQAGPWPDRTIGVPALFVTALVVGAGGWLIYRGFTGADRAMARRRRFPAVLIVVGTALAFAAQLAGGTPEEYGGHLESAHAAALFSLGWSLLAPATAFLLCASAIAAQPAGVDSRLLTWGSITYLTLLVVNRVQALTGNYTGDDIGYAVEAVAYLGLAAVVGLFTIIRRSSSYQN